MVNRKQVIAIAVIAAVILGGTFWLFPTDKRKIKKHFKALSEMALKEGDEPPLAQAKPMRMAPDLFADSCRLFYPARDVEGEFSAEQMGRYAARARQNFKELHLDFYDMAIHISEGGMADVSTTARLSGLTLRGEASETTNELDVSLSKIDGEWRFTEFEIVEVLEK